MLVFHQTALLTGVYQPLEIPHLRTPLVVDSVNLLYRMAIVQECFQAWASSEHKTPR